MRKTAGVVLSFDDGRLDNYNIALSILKAKGIPATFNIATAYVDGTIPKDERPCINESMKVEHVVDLEKRGFEIAGHGDCHQNSLADIERGIGKLKNWMNYSDDRKVGFASPNSKFTEEDFFAEKENLERIGISYVRVGIKNSSSLYGKIMRRLAYLTKSSYLYKQGFQNSLETLSNPFVLHSIPIMNKATVDQVQGIVQEAIKKKKDCILMFHSIVESDSPFIYDDWSWDRKKFEELCEWLVELSVKKMIKLLKTEDLIKHAKG